MDAANGQKPLGGQVPIGGGNGTDKSKEWQMELLMEKLRSKGSAFKTLVETAKNLRMAMLDKRFALDSIEKNQLQKCLDTLQHSIKVTSLQSMVERLESLSRQLGLKFMMSGPAGTELFITSDMFFVEILLETTGVVKDVKIHHEGKTEQQSGEELVACLSRGDFVDFTAQLEGLASNYQLNADKKVKCKAFSALQSLEADLGILAQLQTFMKEPFNLVHKSPVGILERRRGGHAMKLTYFVSPYDLINQENRTCDQLSPEVVTTRKIGHSVTICMEGSASHKLPTSSIITVNRSPTGKSTPSYAPLTGANSSMLPACFVLKLAKKMPMCMELVQRIQKVTELDCGDISAPHPLLSLIVQHASGGQLDCRNNRGLYVTLPDQQHCYFMTENKAMEGVLVGSIPFTHPAHVPQILVYLRQQALFNTLLNSCVRSMARQELEQTTMFEVSALSWQHISVSLEHPFEETMATAELDLTDISALKCKLYGVSMNNTEATSDLVGRVLQRCLSIPLTMRTLIKTWEGRTNGMPLTGIGGNTGSAAGGGTTNGGNYGVGNLSSGQNGHDSNGQTGMPDFNNGTEPKIKQEPGLNGSNGNVAMARNQPSQQLPQPQQQQLQQQQQQQQQHFLDAGTENSIGFPSFSGQSDTTNAMLNPLQLGALLTQSKSNSPVSGISATNQSQSSSERPKKTRKRKTADGMWRSPKSKGEGDSGEILLESSSSDSTPLGTPTGRDNANGTRTPTPTSVAVSLVSGLDITSLDTSDVITGDGRNASSDYDVENDTEVMEVHDLPDDYGDVMKREKKSRKSREEKKSPGLFDENKASSLVPPSVSITPISSASIGQTTNYNSVLTGMGLERRPGIEIIPISSTPQTTLPSSITITPIANPSIKGMSSEERRDRKSKTSSDDKGRLEKKRKRKREDSPMGPPDKLPPKQPQQDVLSKPVSVTIKPTETQPNVSSRPSSPATTLRKFNPSPTHTSPLALVGKSSPTLKQNVATGNSSASTSSTTVTNSSKSIQSPKHSPVYNSPKHGSSGVATSVSPKHGTSSPKHGSSTSAGKPSMSALKSATANNSPSSSKSCSGEQASASSTSAATSSSSTSSSSSSNKPKSSSSKDSNREKDRKNLSSSSTSASSSSSTSTSLSFTSAGSGRQSPKTKSSSSSGKLKQLENVPSNSGETPPTSLPSSGSSTPPLGSSDLGKAAAAAQQQQARNRKGSLSAVIDKLKNAQHCTDEGGPGSGGGSTGGGNGNPQKSSSGNGSGNESGGGGSGQKDRGQSSSSSTKTSSESKSTSKSSSPSIEAKNSAEYMVKHSSDGMKITINKTRAKDSKTSSGGMKIGSSAGSTVSGTLGVSTSSSGSGNGSPKTHTGLKPGVNSGPASKKPQTQSSLKVASQGSGVSSSSSSSSSSFGNKVAPTSSKVSSTAKSSSSSAGSGSLMTKSASSKISTGSPKMSSSGATDLSRNREKPRIAKSSEKSSSSGGNLFASKSTSDVRKASPSGIREESESERAFKVLAAHVTPSAIPNFPPQLVVEGIIKQLDTKFQIPKLSARANASAGEIGEKKSNNDKTSQSSTNLEHPSAKILVDNLTTVKSEQTKNPTQSSTAASSITNNPKSSTSSTSSSSSVTSSLSTSVDVIEVTSGTSRREMVQTKIDNLTATPSSVPIIGSLGAAAMSPASHMLLQPSSALASTTPPLTTSVTHDSDVPTNLSMSTGEDSRDSCKEIILASSTTTPPTTRPSSSLANSQQPFPKSNATLSNPSSCGNDDVVSGHVTVVDSPSIGDSTNVVAKASTYATAASGGVPASNPIVGSVVTSESLNLSTKPADAALSKYKSIDDGRKVSLDKVVVAGGSLTPAGSSSPIDVNKGPTIAGPQEVAELLLDFSTPKDVAKLPLATIPERAMSLQAAPIRRNTPPPPPPPPPPPTLFPPSPSVSVHIVKSPAPSPRVIPPSPHSAASPCITDDELMDEALVGMGK